MTAEKIFNWGELLVLKVIAFAGLRLGGTLAMRLVNLDLHRMAYHVVENYKLQRFRRPMLGKTRLIYFPAFLVEEQAIKFEEQKDFLISVWDEKSAEKMKH